MKIKEEFVVERKGTAIKATICDICKNRVSGDGWGNTFYESSDTEVMMTNNENWGGDGGSVEEISFDICPDCFTKKIIPWLKTLGAEPTIKKTEW